MNRKEYFVQNILTYNCAKKEKYCANTERFFYIIMYRKQRDLK